MQERTIGADPTENMTLKFPVSASIDEYRTPALFDQSLQSTLLIVKSSVWLSQRLVAKSEFYEMEVQEWTT